MKKAVILLNLGGPDKIENVEPFLFNLFNDPTILNLPKILRFPLAKLIANRRAPVAKKIYQKLGGSSPILKLTTEQSEKLEAKLNENKNLNKYKCFIVMRCWHPRASEVVHNVKLFNPDEIILLPLYPQYSASTSGSSIKEWSDVCKSNNYNIKTSILRLTNTYGPGMRIKDARQTFVGIWIRQLLLNKKFEYKKLTKLKVEYNKPNLKKANSLKERIIKTKNI